MALTPRAALLTSACCTLVASLSMLLATRAALAPAGTRLASAAAASAAVAAAAAAGAAAAVVGSGGSVVGGANKSGSDKNSKIDRSLNKSMLQPTSQSATARYSGLRGAAAIPSAGGNNRKNNNKAKKNADAPSVVVEGLNDIEELLSPEVMQLHTDAVAAGADTYTDPRSGFSVFTRVFHLRKQVCCGCRCRHCPYGHANVAAKRALSTNANNNSSDGSNNNNNNSATAATDKKPQEAENKTASDAAAAAAPKRSEVYTKGGDKGTSALFTGERRRKTDVVFEALGTLDELSSHIGVVRALLSERWPDLDADVEGGSGADGNSSSNDGGDGDHKDAASAPEHVRELAAALRDIQQQLLNASTVVATPIGPDGDADPSQPGDTSNKSGGGADPALVALVRGYQLPAKTAALEALIDRLDARLPPLRLFILPGGGTQAAAQLHVARTVCRRAERRMIEVRDAYGADYSDHLRQANVYVNRLSDFLFVASRSVASEDIVRSYDE